MPRSAHHVSQSFGSKSSHAGVGHQRQKVLPVQLAEGQREQQRERLDVAAAGLGAQVHDVARQVVGRVEDRVDAGQIGVLVAVDHDQRDLVEVQRADTWCLAAPVHQLPDGADYGLQLAHDGRTRQDLEAVVQRHGGPFSRYALGDSVQEVLLDSR